MKYERTLAVLLINILVFASCSGQTQELPYDVYLISPAINNYAILPDKPLPKVFKRGKTIKMMACRGEYEPASFLVRTRQPLQAVRVDVSPLTGSAGTIKAQRIDIRVVQPVFRRVTDWPAAIPWLLVHDPQMFVIDDVPQALALAKDALPNHLAYIKSNRLSHEPVDADTLQPGDIADQQQFWITVHVPADAKSGIYSGTISITASNTPETQLTIELWVPDFDLLGPMFEYSIYYPAYLNLDKESPPEGPHIYGPLDEKQYLVELQNMVAHGLTNPNIYGTVIKKKADGTLDFSLLEKIINLREKAGMHGGPLYLVDNSPVDIVSRPLSAEEKASMTDYARQIVAWAGERGYPEVYFMARDEASGEALRAERDSFQAVHAGGGKVFVACGYDFYESVGDLLDLPVVIHPGHGLADKLGWDTPGPKMLRNPERFIEAYSPRKYLSPGTQEMIQNVHRNGFKFFTYIDPLAGTVLPQVHRRNKGLGLWKAGLDGTMTWAYNCHITGEPLKPIAGGYRMDQSLLFNYVWRGKHCVIDTLGWEGFREGVDDARYLTTLLAALRMAKASGSHSGLVGQTERWLDEIDIDADLDDVRLEMARRIEAILKR